MSKLVLHNDIRQNNSQATDSIQLISSFFNCTKVKLFNYTVQFYKNNKFNKKKKKTNKQTNKQQNKQTNKQTNNKQVKENKVSSIF